MPRRPRTRESTDDGALVHRFSLLCGLVVQMGDDFRQQSSTVAAQSPSGEGRNRTVDPSRFWAKRHSGRARTTSTHLLSIFSAVSAIDQSDPPAPRSCTRDRGPRGFRFPVEPDGSPSPTLSGVQGGLNVRFNRLTFRRSTSRCHPGLPARGFSLRARRERWRPSRRTIRAPRRARNRPPSRRRNRHRNRRPSRRPSRPRSRRLSRRPSRPPSRRPSPTAEPTPEPTAEPTADADAGARPDLRAERPALDRERPGRLPARRHRHADRLELARRRERAHLRRAEAGTDCGADC